MKLRCVFMGSPEIAIPALRVAREHTDLVRVVCQPDKPAGRGRKLTAPAVKLEAEAHGLVIDQPTKMRDGTLAQRLRADAPDLMIVVAFGRILPKDVLDVARHGCINVHFSLLPRWRGAAPVQRAILAGDTRTGVSVMQMDEGLDTGPVHLVHEVDVDRHETSGELGGRLSHVGAAALREFLQAFPRAHPPVPQDETAVTLAPPLRKDEGLIDWTRTVLELVNHVRGMDPWPVAFTMMGGERLSLFAAQMSERNGSGHPGQVVGVDDRGMHVACSDGTLVVADVQPAGKRRMPALAFASGRSKLIGATLGA